jgi:YHS domain-containing protein
MAMDPVCKMTVDEKSAKFKADLNGKTYYFCSSWCQGQFKADPGKYAR